MPLDVQPLSPLRRVLLVVVMAALLALSLGAAQLLVRRQAALGMAGQGPGAGATPGPVVVVQFLPPPGLAAMPVNLSTDANVENAYVEMDLAQGPRALWAFYVPSNDTYPPQAYVEILLHRILPDPAPLQIDLGKRLGGLPALQAERYLVTGQNSEFAMIRLAALPGHIVAFCLSGEGPPTDADREFLDAYCTQRIFIHAGPETKG